MWADLVTSTGLLAALMAGWYVLQRWVRRNVPEMGNEQDILEGRWGCRGCFLVNRCDREAACSQSPSPKS